MDSLTLDALRLAFAFCLERFQEELKAGRSHEWAVTAATSALLPRMNAALEEHEKRRHVCVQGGKDFRYEANLAASRLVALLRTGSTYEDAFADYWKRLNSAVEHKELF